MVKGTSRRVIVVKTPDTELFEQAIFLVRSDAGADGVSAERLVSEACRVTRSYTRTHTPRRTLRRLPSALWALGGALLVAAAWLFTTL